VDESIEDRVRDRAVAEIGVPLVDRELTGNERRAPVISIIEDLENANKLHG
jgi:hypothetical protein